MAFIFKLLLVALKNMCRLWERMMALFQTQIRTRIEKNILAKELVVSMNGGRLFLMRGIKVLHTLRKL